MCDFDKTMDKVRTKKFYTGKTALVTGAGSGIGEAISCNMAKNGANVIVTGLGMEELERVCEICRGYGVKAWPFEFNLEKRETIDDLVSFMEKEELKPEVIVFNAGISQRALALDTDFSVDLKLMDINYLGSVYMTKKLAPMLKAAKCTHIGVNTSISGLFGFPLRSAYSASKRALFGFFESLDLENDNIKVTFIIPGRVNTQISKSAILADGKPYAKMDPGQANGMDVDRCGKIAVRAIAKGRHRKLIGGIELLMAYIYKYTPWLYWKLAKKVSAT